MRFSLGIVIALGTVIGSLSGQSCCVCGTKSTVRWTHDWGKACSQSPATGARLSASCMQDRQTLRLSCMQPNWPNCGGCSFTQFAWVFGARPAKILVALNGGACFLYTSPDIVLWTTAPKKGLNQSELTVKVPPVATGIEVHAQVIIFPGSGVPRLNATGTVHFKQT